MLKVILKCTMFEEIYVNYQEEIDQAITASLGNSMPCYDYVEVDNVEEI